MTFALAATCALLLGVVDYLAGVTLRHDGRHEAALSYTALASAVGLLVVLAILPLVLPEHVARADIMWAIAAGLSIGIALPLLMLAMARGPIAIVAPVIGLMSLAVPAIAGPMLGDMLTRWDVIGVLLALPAAALVATVSESDRSGGAVPSTVALATLVGGLLGAAAVFFGRTGEESGIGPAVVAQVTATVLLVVSGVVSGRLVRLRRSGVTPAVAMGVLNVLAVLSSVLAFQRGPVSVVAAIIGMAPGVTVVLAWLVVHERIGRRQLIGFGLGAVAVVLFAMG
jgi:drug/metabolite transporter (DMT)-like permease